MSPKNTATLVDSNRRLIQEFGPAASNSAAPAVGGSAHQPGKASLLLIAQIEPASKLNPATEATSPPLEDRQRCRSRAKPPSPDAGRPTFSRYASPEPSINSQKRGIGKKNAPAGSRHVSARFAQ